MSFMNGKRYLNNEEVTDVIMNHDFREAQIILRIKGILTKKSYLNIPRRRYRRMFQVR